MFPALSVAENIFMGDEALSNEKRRFYHKKEYIEKAKKVLDYMKININSGGIDRVYVNSENAISRNRKSDCEKRQNIDYG